LESRPGENVKIGANINFLLFNGKTEFNIFDFLRMDSGEINGETISPLSEPLLDEMYLDNIQSAPIHNRKFHSQGINSSLLVGGIDEILLIKNIQGIPSISSPQ